MGCGGRGWGSKPDLTSTDVTVPWPDSKAGAALMKDGQEGSLETLLWQSQEGCVSTYHL